MIAPELVVERDVNDEVAVPPKVDVLEHQISPPNFPVGSSLGIFWVRIKGLPVSESLSSRLKPFGSDEWALAVVMLMLTGLVYTGY